MADDGNEAAPAGADSPEGVFGNLPSKRPGSRSPRRRETKGEGDAQPEANVDDATKAPETPPEPAPVAAEPETPEPEPPEPGDDPLAPQPAIQGVEDLAWAGVAVVAQAATAGIRFTSRALDAARKSIDRP